MNEAPLVSICCLTYNHAPFIRKCLDGFLMQETNFPLEILIHDDASTDGTSQIVKEYADKYPDLIIPQYEAENQFSKGKSSTMDIEYNYSRARGKYIACCEGDDFWTDPLKLQRQVDFLESHTDYSICFHRYRYMFYPSGETKDDSFESLFESNEKGCEVTIPMFFSHWITQPFTMVFRKSNFNPFWQKEYKLYRDTHEIYHLLKSGKGYLFSFVGGTHIKHDGGMSSSLSMSEGMSTSYSVVKDLFINNKGDKYVRDYFANVLKWILSDSRDMGMRQYIKLITDYLCTSKDIKFLFKLLLKKR